VSKNEKIGPFLKRQDEEWPRVQKLLGKAGWKGYLKAPTRFPWKYPHDFNYYSFP
jgi:hypothetical protein